jgi:hypothetical protein
MKLREFSIILGTLGLSVSFAAPAYTASQTQKATAGGVFSMPVGDHRSLQPAPQSALFTRVPIGDQALVALKNGAATRSMVGASNPATTVPLKDSTNTPDALFPSALCNGNIATGSAPSDIHGAVGNSRFVVITNVDIGVYNRAGCTIVSRVSLKTFFAGFAGIANQSLFDPRVLYDRAVGRFFVTAESRQTGITDQYQYFAVSTDSTASAWRRYRFRLSDATGVFCKRAATNFWDYPQAGKSFNRWFITANDFQGNVAAGAILAIDKAPSLTGASLPTGKCFNNLPSNLAPPIVLDSNIQSVFLAPRTSGSILRLNYTAAGAIGTDSLAGATSYSIPAWTVPPDAVQPNGQRLDSLDGRFQSASIQSRDRIWNIHAIAFGTRPLIRWYRLRRAASTVLQVTTFQSSTNSHLFNPSFVTNSGVDGSPAFITASRTDPTCAAVACRAAMITFSGPNSDGSAWTQSLAGTSTTNFATDGFGNLCNTIVLPNKPRASCRWGDYSAITVDPLNAGRAWGFNQLINGTTQFNWFTRAAEETYNLQSAPEGSSR